MENAAKERLIAELRSIIEGEQEQVVPAVRAAIHKHISEKSPAECLTLVQRSSTGVILSTIPTGLNKRYATALISFVRRRDFEGRELDSGLTDSTSAVVAETFTEKLGEKADEIVERAVPILLSDRRFVDALSGAVIDSCSSTVPRQLQRKAVAIFSAKMSGALTQAIDTGSATIIKAGVAKVAGVAITSPVAMKVSFLIVRSMATVLKPLIVKFLASSAFKAAVMSKLKAIVIGSMLGAFIKIIGVKLGLSAGSAFMIVLVPVVLAWLAYEVSHFPEKLAAKVAEGVAQDLENSFGDMSRSLADSLTENLLSTAMSLIADDLVSDDLIRKWIDDSIAEAA